MTGVRGERPVRHQFIRLPLRILEIAKAANPTYLCISAEPRHLTFGVIAMALLGCADRFIAWNLAIQKLRRLFVSQGAERGSRGPLLFEEYLRLLYEAPFEHLRRALVNTCVQGVSIRIETNAQNAKALQRIAPFFPKLGHGLPAKKAHFDSAHDLRILIGVNFLGGGVIEAEQNSEQI